ncbi:hypothetical protein [Streptomyces violaceus]|uniref:Uncharacterized protein n=1 Tax=Streptomyces violaceus TaxID=1936 RepID=A0ABY9UF24_STRVL|nr:hypothetical protein [Streptomyces janthinus]WND21463.1 hypothetical protein RI060_30795 [Streptomyces janthinus]GGS45366.1 hypothetical protein GCM10010270_14050 [Streptomyces janthinus]
MAKHSAFITSSPKAAQVTSYWDPQSVESGKAMGIHAMIQRWSGCQFCYAVADEVTTDVITMEVSSWPTLDSRGRPVFPPIPSLPLSTIDDDEKTVILDIAAKDLNCKVRVVFGISQDGSPVQEGEVFGMAIVPKAWPEPDHVVRGDAVTELIPSPLYDVTSEAWELSRVALLASLTPPMDEEEANGILSDEPLGES